MELELAVRYPFSQYAHDALKSIQHALDERAIAWGEERIRKALEGKLAMSTALHTEDRWAEVIAYATARVILGYTYNRHVTNTFAVAEAKRASQYFQKEKEEVLCMLESDLDCAAEATDGGYWIPLPQYVRYAPGAPPYKLIHRRIQRGRVFANRHERLRLLEEAVRLHTLHIPPVHDPPDAVKQAAERLKAVLPELERPLIPLKGGDYPPCIRLLLEDLKRHENLPHHARWYLAVYLLYRGMPMEQMVSLYSNLPDFNEKITRYQIEHAKKRGYSVPTCASIKSWGISCPNCKRKSPLQWRGKGEKHGG